MCRQRVQQITLGHRGHSGDPLYGIKRVLLTREMLRTDKQKARLEAVFADEQHLDVEVTEHVYQDLVAAYSDPDKRAGKLTMFKTLKRLKSGVPTELAELAQLGRSLWNAGKRSSPTSTPAHRTVRSKRSTDDSNTSVESPSASATSTTTSCGH